MKRALLILLASIFVIGGCASKTKHAKTKFIKDFVSKYDANKTIEVIKDNLSKKNYQLISVYNHTKDATKLKQMLYPTYTLTFNNPKISTTLLQCSPTMSADLPINIGIYNEINGKTHMVFTDSEYWSLKHNVSDNKCLKLLILIKQDLLDVAKKIEVESKD